MLSNRAIFLRVPHQTRFRRRICPVIKNVSVLFLPPSRCVYCQSDFNLSQLEASWLPVRISTVYLGAIDAGDPGFGCIFPYAFAVAHALPTSKGQNWRFSLKLRTPPQFSHCSQPVSVMKAILTSLVVSPYYNRTINCSMSSMNWILMYLWIYFWWTLFSRKYMWSSNFAFETGVSSVLPACLFNPSLH